MFFLFFFTRMEDSLRNKQKICIYSLNIVQYLWTPACDKTFIFLSILLENLWDEGSLGEKLKTISAELRLEF